MQGNYGPPIPASPLNGDVDFQQWGLDDHFNDSPEFLAEPYERPDNNTNTVPMMHQHSHSHSHTLSNSHSSSYTPYHTAIANAHMHMVYPMKTYHEPLHVPTYDASPISPGAMSTPTMSPMSTNISMSSPIGTVPSPISPQQSPAPPVPVSPRVKLEATDNEQWQDYENPNRTYYSLYNSRQQSMSSAISVRTRITADNLEFNAIDGAYVMYRQNQFQIEIDFVGGLANYSSSSTEPYYILQETPQGNNFIRAEGLYFYMYAVKHQRLQPFDPDMVEITQSCGSRNAKETQTPGLSTIANGRALYNKLQFRAATQYNARSSKAPTQPNPQQQFYRIVIVLVAKVETGLEFINSRISPCLVVRGQNPGRFKENQVAAAAAPVNIPMVIPMSSPIPVHPPIAVPTVPVMPQVELAKNPVVSNITPHLPPHIPILSLSPAPSPSPVPSPVQTRQSKRNTRVTVKPEKGHNKRQRAGSDDEDYEVRETAPPGWMKGSTPNTICIQKGKVGINTTAPQEALHVQGNVSTLLHMR